MLEKFREGAQGPVAKIILGLVILSFALAGVGGYLGSTDEDAVAVVNGEEISAQALEQAYQSDRARMQQRLGEAFEELAINPAYQQQLREGARQRLIAETLVRQQVQELGLRVGDQQMKQFIRTMPEFQRDGKFDNDVYLRLLRQSSLTPEQFVEMSRRDLAQQQLTRALFASEFSLPGEIGSAQTLDSQEREVQTMILLSDVFADKVEISDEDIQSFYDNNLNRFYDDERIAVEYIELSSTGLEAELDVLDEDIQEYYDNHAASFASEPAVRVAHIQINKDNPDAQKILTGIQAELADGADFAVLAKEKSDDFFSAENGGEMDWFEAGATPDEAFELAAFALENDGNVSDIVETEFGFHLIKRLEARPVEQQSLAEVREEIVTELKQTEALNQFYELKTRLSEVAFEIPDSLDDAASETGLSMQQLPLTAKSELTGALANPKVLQVLFSDEAIIEGLNSDIVEINDDEVIVVRVTEHQPEQQLPLEEVRDSIVEDLSIQQKAELAHDTAGELIAKLEAGESIDDQLTELEINFDEARWIGRANQELSANVTETIFSAVKPAEGEVTYQLASQGPIQTIIRITGVRDGEQSFDAEMLNQVLVQQETEHQYQMYLKALQASAEIEK